MLYFLKILQRGRGKKIKSRGPGTEPCGTPQLIVVDCDLCACIYTNYLEQKSATTQNVVDFKAALVDL